MLVVTCEFSDINTNQLIFGTQPCTIVSGTWAAAVAEGAEGADWYLQGRCTCSGLRKLDLQK